MRKALTAVMVVVLGLMLGGCTHCTKYDAKFVASLQPEHRVRVETANKGIKVVSILPNKKFIRTMADGTGKRVYIDHADFVKFFNAVVEKALKEAGYFEDNNSDITVKIKLEKFGMYSSLLGYRRTKLRVTVLRNGMIVLTKTLEKKKPWLLGWGYQNATNSCFRQLYNLLYSFFTSKEFRQALE